MDFITNSLEAYLQSTGINYYTAPFPNSYRFRGCSKTYVDLLEEHGDSAIYLLIEINSKHYTISITLCFNVILSHKSVKRFKSVEKEWNRGKRFTTLSINKEEFKEFGEWYSLQLFSNFLSEANGLTRSLWGKYLRLLYIEATELRDLISEVEIIG